MYMIIQGVQSVRQLKSRRTGNIWSTPDIIQISFQGPKHKYNSLKISWFLADLYIQSCSKIWHAKKKKKKTEWIL